MTTSGGQTSAVIPHLWRLALKKLNKPENSIIFIDTGYYSSSTLDMVKKLELLDYKITKYLPLLSPSEIEKSFPNWQDPESENFIKVKEIIKREPLNRVISNHHTQVWVSGVMRDETLERKNSQVIEYDQDRKIYHFHPIVDWTKSQALEYINQNKLPINDHHFDIAKGANQDLECGLHIKA